MDLIPFSELNRALVAKLSDPQLHDGKFSFLKILQHGLSYAMLNDEKKLVRNYLSLPLWVIRLLYFVKATMRKKLQNKTVLRKFVVIDEGRTVHSEDGHQKSIYFNRILEITGRQKTTIISKRKVDGNFDYDYLMNDLPQANSALDHVEIEMLVEIKNCLEKIRIKFSKHEIAFMQSSLHVFFESFRFYHRLFKSEDVAACLFCVHYHNEGLIAALSIHRIKSIEVQHGLIANNDFYYVYDRAFAHCTARAFFPDYILLYGPYWKRILLNGSEWKPEQLVVAGDYLFRPEESEKPKPEKENIIFIGAQKNIPEDYVRYTKNLQSLLAQKHPEWKIVVKIHPLEKEPHLYYDQLVPLGVQVVGNEKRLDEILVVAKIQISVFSTTFFDALGLDVVNFSLQNYSPASDYAADMVREGIALPLHEDDDPIDQYQRLKENDFSPMARAEVYAPFDGDRVKAMLQ